MSGFFAFIVRTMGKAWPVVGEWPAGGDRSGRPEGIGVAGRSDKSAPAWPPEVPARRERCQRSATEPGHALL
jgi:hypothetical protein